MADKDNNPGSSGLLAQANIPPDDNPKTAFGLAKCPLHLVPPLAIHQEAEVFALGAKKYGPYNWREKTVSVSVYYAAALRHIMAYWEGEDADPESGVTHLAHVRACMAILIDAESRGKLNDDRPLFKEAISHLERLVPRYDDKGVVEPPCS